MVNMARRPSPYETIPIAGDQLRRLRKQHGLSQEALAFQAAPISRGYISSLEHAPTSRVGPELAERLAAALGTSVAAIAPAGVQGSADEIEAIEEGERQELLRELRELRRIDGEYHQETKMVGLALSGVSGELQKLRRALALLLEAQHHQLPNSSEPRIIQDWLALQSALFEELPLDPPSMLHETVFLTSQTTYDPASNAYLGAVLRLEQEPGNRYMLLAGVSDISVPAKVDKDRIRALRGMNPDPRLERQTRRALQQRNRRRELALQHLQPPQRRRGKWSRYRDICTMRALQRWADHGVYSWDDPLLAYGADPECSDQIVAHIDNLIDLLNTYDNYELGLVDDRAEEIRGIGKPSYLIKEGYAIIVETPSLGDGHAKVVESEDPRMIEGFRKHFDEVWRGDYAPIETRRSSVIKRLEDYREIAASRRRKSS